MRGLRAFVVLGGISLAFPLATWGQDAGKSDPAKIEAKRRPTVIDEPLVPLAPKTPRTTADQDRIEALSLFAAGRLHEQRQEFNEAFKLYHKALRYNPDNVTILRQVYQLALNLERVEEGIRFALKLVQLDPTDQVLIRRLGAHLTDRRDYAGALKLYERLKEHPGLDKKSPAFVTLMAQMGDLYFLVDKYALAADCYGVVEAALDKPDDYHLNERMRTILLGTASTTYERFGIAYLKADRPKQAIAAFQRADKSSPNKGLFALHQAQVYASSKEPAKALAELEVFFQHQVKGQGSEPYELLAKVLKELDKQGELVERLEKALTKDASNAALQYYLADQYRAANQVEKAEKLYVEALKDSPSASGYEGLLAIYRKKNDPIALLKLLGTGIPNDETILDRPEGKALLGDAKMVDEVLAAARKLNAEDEKKLDYEMRIAAALLAAEAKKFDVSSEFFQLALATNPAEPLRVYQQWGLVLFVGEQYAEAARVLQQAVDKKLAQPKDPTLLFHLSGALEMAGKTDEALEIARKAVDMTVAPVPLLHQRVAWIQYHAKRYEEATKAYHELIEKFPGTPTSREARLVLSNISVIKKDMTRAEEYLEQVLDEYPDDPGASNDLGYLWADQGKHLERALKMIKLALEADPDNEAYLDSLGWALYKLGRYQEALEPLKKSAAAEDADAVILDHLAECYLRLNQTEESVKLWKRALIAAEKSRNPDPEKKQQIEQKLKLHEKNNSQSRLQPAKPGAP
jgi:tetratricopeptide (TPR) repeat protein